MRRQNLTFFFMAVAALGLIVLLALYFSRPGKDGKDAADNPLFEKDGRPAVIIQAAKALEMLKAGNRRYLTMERMKDPGVNKESRKMLLKGAAPFATILSCSDSRVPPEIFFDAGLGQIFVVRNAGNQLWPDALGSIEYASVCSTSRLIVVMGHQSCRMVTAAVKVLRMSENSETPAIGAMTCNLFPSVLNAGKKDPNLSEEKLIEAACRENIRMICKAIPQSSEALRKMNAAGKLKIIGAYADLESGSVEFFQP